MKKIIIAIICVFVITIILCTCYGIKQINDMKWKSDKDYYSFIIEQEDIVDYSVFMRPYGEYKKLNAIDYETREKIAQYMRNNNLKLSVGNNILIDLIILMRS